MPEVAMWSLIVAFIVFSSGITLKAVEYRRLFDKADKETSDLRTEMAVIKKHYEETITRMAKINNNKIPQLTQDEREMLTKRIERLTKDILVFDPFYFEHVSFSDSFNEAI